MIPLVRPAIAEGDAPYVTRLRSSPIGAGSRDSVLVDEDNQGSAFSGSSGLVAIDGLSGHDLDGDVVLVQPRAGRIERLFRAASVHNTLLVTERCDQLCVMCSQPPKKTHVDRFDLFEDACLLVAPGTLIGVSGGEPTLYKDRLLAMIERVLRDRPDLQFHVLSNGQHFEQEDIQRLRDPVYRRVSWGIPLYATEPALHDDIVGKVGAHERLEESLGRLIMAGARVELRTVVLETNIDMLPELARGIAARLQFIEAWSIMQLEHIGFAKGRWRELFVDHSRRFGPIATALDHASLHGVRAQLFNFPRCTVPSEYRRFAIASISDWKRKYASACGTCCERQACSGFFEWHPDEEAEMAASPL